MATYEPSYDSESLRKVIQLMGTYSRPPRPEERIDAILDIVREAWKANPDYRLWQLLMNWCIDFHTEDLTTFVENMHRQYWTTKLLWWTRWKSWKAKLQYKPIGELDTDHIAAILKTQPLAVETRKIFEEEYAKRIANWI